jgi:uncharacterized protein
MLGFLAGILASILLAAIRFYQLTLSSVMGRHCRYLPTCSEYAATAISLHGPWRGFLMGLARVSRCHPLGGEGLDPVPETYDGPHWRQKKKGP